MKYNIEIYNLGSGIQTSVYEIADSVVKKLKLNLSLKFQKNTLLSDPLYWHSDSKKFMSTGFFPHYSLSQGLSNVSKWIKELNDNNENFLSF